MTVSAVNIWKSKAKKSFHGRVLEEEKVFPRHQYMMQF